MKEKFYVRTIVISTFFFISSGVPSVYYFFESLDDYVEGAATYASIFIITFSYFVYTLYLEYTRWNIMHNGKPYEGIILRGDRTTGRHIPYRLYITSLMRGKRRQLGLGL